jgi:hypothetical protein
MSPQRYTVPLLKEEKGRHACCDQGSCSLEHCTPTASSTAAEMYTQNNLIQASLVIFLWLTIMMLNIFPGWRKGTLATMAPQN